MSANDTAATALDWPGEYKGVLPCSDCQGIETELELKMDKTYELSEEFLGRANGQESKITGTFEFDPNDPAVIILDQAANNRKFFVGENFIEARDVNNGAILMPARIIACKKTCNKAQNLAPLKVTTLVNASQLSKF